MKAIDTPNDTTGHAHALVDAGIECVGLYLRPDRASKAMVDGLALVGIKRVSVYEKGLPTHAGFFTSAQGAIDARAAIAFARTIGQPASEIFFAVDYDAAEADLPAIRDYFVAVRKVLASTGYLASVYGSGLVCKALTGAGLAHSGWLAQSQGWAGYENYKPHAAIVQGVESKLRLPGAVLDIDWNQVVDSRVCW